jgi:hypothetical protein
MRTTKPLLAVEQHGKLPQDVQCFMLLPEIFCSKIYFGVSPALLTVAYESKMGGCAPINYTYSLLRHWLFG